MSHSQLLLKMFYVPRWGQSVHLHSLFMLNSSAPKINILPFFFLNQESLSFPVPRIFKDSSVRCSVSFCSVYWESCSSFITSPQPTPSPAILNSLALLKLCPKRLPLGPAIHCVWPFPPCLSFPFWLFPLGLVYQRCNFSRHMGWRVGVQHSSCLLSYCWDWPM